MKKYTKIAKSDKDIGDAVKFINVISEFPVKITVESYTEETKKERMKGYQQRLKYLWINDIVKAKVEMLSGWTAEEWNYHFKERFLLPIFVRDVDGWSDTMIALTALKVEGYMAEYEHLKRGIINTQLSSKNATVEQGIEYLKDIERFAHSSGVFLRTDVFYSEAGL